MAQTRVGSAIVCTLTETVAGKLDIVGIISAATTSATISDGTTEFFSCGSTKETHNVCIRLDSAVVTVTGGGYVTLLLRV